MEIKHSYIPKYPSVNRNLFKRTMNVLVNSHTDAISASQYFIKPIIFQKYHNLSISNQSPGKNSKGTIYRFSDFIPCFASSVNMGSIHRRCFTEFFILSSFSVKACLLFAFIFCVAKTLICIQKLNQNQHCLICKNTFLLQLCVSL